MTNLRMKMIKAYLAGALRVARANRPGAVFPMFRDYIRIRRELRSKLSETIATYRVDNPGQSYEKYLDIDYWLWGCMGRYYRLELDRSPRTLKILDLGTGAGFFPYVCRFYGHQVECLDIPDVPMYNDIIRALGLKRYEQRIVFSDPLITSERYDLITAFMICFNQHKRPDLWHVSEWDQFVSGLEHKNLLDGGRLFLAFNAESKQEPVKPDLLQFFSREGAVVRGTEVLLPRRS